MITNDGPMIASPFSPELVAALCEPFPISALEIRPGATNQEKTSALALPYADARVYEDRLDAVVGVGNWSVDFVPWGEQRLIARLTILGVTQSSTGEGDANDPNTGTIAEAQAFKRSCSKFGLGRYLYALPKIWGKGSVKGKHFMFDDGEAQRILTEMYRRAALLQQHHAASAAPQPRPHAAPSAPASNPRLQTARAALAEAEAKAATPDTRTVRRPPKRLEFPPRAEGAQGAEPPSDGASIKQRGYIARLIDEITDADEVFAEDINDLGAPFGLPHLADLDTPQALATVTLSKRDAGSLIDDLKVLLAHATAQAA